ncbi:hypothetical protein BZL54_13600 [Burkholderia ubonensis subsp. mesacidophila]|uniref:Uncharacterized protein n=1 Tax=Burkholderia ubonensis subsp. mesacidophila TaxID=265293 RepID=A0A2A4FFL3_9BURK|nr:hypothetical protein BZL54_13600 [Burkholderia ubonensis subsp. mesacidophila]
MPVVPPVVEPTVPPTLAGPTAPFPLLPLLPLPGLVPLPLPAPPWPPTPPLAYLPGAHADGSAAHAAACPATGIVMSAPSGIAFCATCNGAVKGGVSSPDCPATGPIDVASCATAYEPQQQANAAAASKVAR